MRYDSPSCAFGSALRIARRTASRLARDSFGFDATYSRTDATRFLDRLAVMLRTLCAHPIPPSPELMDAPRGARSSPAPRRWSAGLHCALEIPKHPELRENRRR